MSTKSAAPPAAPPPSKASGPPGGAPPPAAGPSGGAAPLVGSTGPLSITRGKVTGKGQRILLYGDGGAGKTSLAALIAGLIFLDLERGTRDLDTVRMQPSTFAEVRGALANRELETFSALVLDSGSTLQTFTNTHVLETIPHEKGGLCSSIEDYGWNKGYRHIYEQFALVLADLDRHAEAGRHVCLICHAEATKAPNPKGQEWERWEPHLQNRSGANIRSHVVQWADHVLFLGKDVNVEKGKGVGGTTRTLYFTDDATMLAKSRRLRGSRPITEGDDSVWREILNA